MKRKDFLQKGFATGAFASTSALISPSYSTIQEENGRKVPWGYDIDYSEVRIERPIKGKPHQGKVLLAIQPHSDDIPLSAGGLVAKLMDEGYTGYLCSVTDDARGEGEYKQNRIDNQNLSLIHISEPTRPY